MHQFITDVSDDTDNGMGGFWSRLRRSRRKLLTRGGLPRRKFLKRKFRRRFLTRGGLPRRKFLKRKFRRRFLTRGGLPRRKFLKRKFRRRFLTRSGLPRRRLLKRSRPKYLRPVRRARSQLFRAKRAFIPRRKGPARAKFLRWMSYRQPKLYRSAVNVTKIKRRMMGRQVSGLDVEGEIALAEHGGDMSGLWADMVGYVGKTLPTLAMAYQQRVIFKENLKRARMGLSPLKADEIAPSVRIEADLGPDTVKRMATEGKKGLEQYLIPGLIIGGIFYAMKSQGKNGS